MSRIKNFLYDNPNFCKYVDKNSPYAKLCGSSAFEQTELVPMNTIIVKPLIVKKNETVKTNQMELNFGE